MDKETAIDLLFKFYSAWFDDTDPDREENIREVALEVRDLLILPVKNVPGGQHV